MPGLICGRRNNGELYLSDGSGLYCHHGGPADVLGRGYYRREALNMDDCANCEFVENCREGVRIPCPWETVEIVKNPNI